MRALLVVLAVLFAADLAQAAPPRLVRDLTPAVDGGGGVADAGFFIADSSATLLAGLAIAGFALFRPGLSTLLVLPLGMLGIAMLQTVLGEMFEVPVTGWSAALGSILGVLAGLVVGVGVGLLVDASTDVSSGTAALAGFLFGDLTLAIVTPLVATSELAGATGGCGGDVPVRPLEPVRSTGLDGRTLTVAAFSF